ncbi:type 1 glutamine amidotransferase domain-containing protein [Loigolactobacillus coryniformis]|uniref:Type 1 glutamine amidotransferase n=1 Tax=Loigolactobacillus coryniformis TaxID=1610 RepID=A0A5B8TG38_9LACO|nr:type 1 glutamine amidotransferase domain-containing protein [Loigolactobacillus coryniformis]QEA52778.1 type 1 glutamine amidotransferase [Loigolactobacillus coryniformis]
MTDNKLIAVLVTNGVEDVELTSPREALSKEGYQLCLIGQRAGEIIQGKKGTPFLIERGIDEVQPQDFRALFISGGFSPDQLRGDQRFVDFTKAFLEQKRQIFAICHGPQLFIQTGLAAQLELTAYKTVQPDLAYAGATVKNQPVVVSDHLITSRNPNDLPAFNQAIVSALTE